MASLKPEVEALMALYSSVAVPKFTIRESSLIAELAAKKLRVSSVAFVLGNTIYLHNVNTLVFLKNERWVKHELCHINQFKRHGFLPFIVKYLIASLRSGYYENKYEVEARAAEYER